ncbi:uncharacterized protein J8A68_005411 [[Candida] subhashii]|uniref:Uncharacterized protein n=1 Tax=[Candida] subhashii TaxID=561895 RepID=A0A8J5UVI6_9ASCO|nr:uncharacterized protein J8A68_005411 [[Candida] subhashii]KAG7661039.1 hypothetical protein J8A68_005411 [[Candida] subhashii]
MRFQIISILFLVFSWVTAVPVQESTLAELSTDLNNWVQTNFNSKEIAAYDQLLEPFSKAGSIQKREAYEEFIEAALLQINQTGILWTLLDAVALNESRIQTVTGFLGALLSGVEYKIDVGALLTQALSGGLDLSSLESNPFVAAVIQSGLIESFLDGMLLDDQFRPVLVELSYSLILSQREAIKALLTGFLQQTQAAGNAKRADGDEEVAAAQPAAEEAAAEAPSQEAPAEEASAEEASAAEEPAAEDASTEVTDTTGSLNAFLLTALNELLKSPFFQEVAIDTINALNDTGVAVYVTKRFLSTPAYVNLVGAITQTVIQSGAIQIDFSTLDVATIIQAALANFEQIISLVVGFFSGDSSATAGLMSILGKYGAPIMDIIAGLEQKGLFYQLNEYIFGAGDQAASTQSADQVLTDGTQNKATEDEEEGSTSGAISLKFSAPLALLAASALLL